MTSKNNLIHFARVSRPHGIKGEAELFLFNPGSDLVCEGQVFEAQKADGQIFFLTLKSVRFGNKVIAKFDEIFDRTELEKLLPFDLYIERSKFADSTDEEFYLVDLIGMDVVNTSGVRIGKLDKVYENGAQQIFVVRSESGASIELPYAKIFFPKVDLEKKQITIILPEYTE